jgi:hypothetical protein
MDIHVHRQLAEVIDDGCLHELIFARGLHGKGRAYTTDALQLIVGRWKTVVNCHMILKNECLK